jgi:protein tyrosine phosphatase (PTP) superfamily phosphohydrolase (DUF442 family)
MRAAASRIGSTKLFIGVTMKGVNPKLLRALAMGLLAASLCSAAGAQDPSKSANPAPAEHVFAQKIVLNGVPNPGEVTPLLFRGAQPSAEGFSALSKMGIGIVIDLRGERDGERERVTALGMQYIAIPSHCSHMNDEGVAKFLTILRDNPDKKIFVHCVYGVDRTGMMIAAYRMAQGWTADESRREMESFGFSRKHRAMCPGLASFESRFPSAFANNSAFENLRPSGSGPANSHPSAGSKD